MLYEYVLVYDFTIYFLDPPWVFRSDLFEAQETLRHLFCFQFQIHLICWIQKIWSLLPSGYPSSKQTAELKNVEKKRENDIDKDQKSNFLN